MRISDRDFLTDIPAADDLKEKLVSYRKQGEIVDGWLKIRLEKVLPMVMKRGALIHGLCAIMSTMRTRCSVRCRHGAC